VPGNGLVVKGWMMVKAELKGELRVGNQQADSTAKRSYRAPKLTVVGTVHDLTLGIGNEGAPDTNFNTQGGG
jgi:hypothetical protein